jgi:phospholipid transport system substrate-binding protein
MKLVTMAGLLGLVGIFSTPFANAAAQAPAAVPAASSPHELVRRTSSELVDLIKDAKGYADEDPDRYYSAVQDILDPIVDFRSFARLVMASHYKRATPDQRNRFAINFKRGLVRTYASALLEFTDEEIKVLDPKGAARNPKRPSVKMEIRTASGTIYPMSYTMGRGKDGVWRMKNIIINGINIGLTFRNQFAGAVRDKKYSGDLDLVIDSWGDLVAEVDATGASES